MPVYVDIHLKIELERSFEENMEPNEEKRDRMDLRFMFYAGLRKWKAMIIAGLIIAVLLGIYAIISSITASNDDYANWDRVVEIRDNKLKYSNSMDEAELDNVTIDKKISDQQEYLDKSIYIILTHMTFSVLRRNIIYLPIIKYFPVWIIRTWILQIR